MGSSLDKPKTEKETEFDSGQLSGKEVSFAVSAMQGWRVEMEDDHIACINVEEQPNLGFFGVFDGHGGDFTSKFAAEYLLPCILNTDAFKKTKTSDNLDAESLKEAMIQGFLQMDEQLRNQPTMVSGQDFSGSTAVVTCVTKDHYVVANCGDSRLVLVRDNQVHFATDDHKPYNPKEKERIEFAGGYVMMQRVNGDLAVSRALGDFVYKRAMDLPATKQQVTAEPHVTIIPRDDKDQFLIIACDGIWDVVSNNEAAAYVHKLMTEGYELGEICEILMDECLERNSRDNMSVLVVALPGAPQEIGTRKTDAVQSSTVDSMATGSDATTSGQASIN